MLKFYQKVYLMHTYKKKQFSLFDISTIINNPMVNDRDMYLLKKLYIETS